TSTYIDIAISNGADATAGFTNFRQIQTNVGTNYASFPRLGYNWDGYYVTYNLFGPKNAFNYTVVLSIQKSTFLTGGLTTYTHALSNGIPNAIPARMHGQTSANSGGPEYFVIESDANGGLAIDVDKATNLLSSTPTFAGTEFNVTAYYQFPAAFPQPGG